MGSGNSTEHIKQSAIFFPEQIQIFENVFRQLALNETKLTLKQFCDHVAPQALGQQLLQKIFDAIRKQPLGPRETPTNATTEITNGQLFAFLENVCSGRDQIKLVFEVYQEGGALDESALKQLLYDNAAMAEYSSILCGHFPTTKQFAKEAYDQPVRAIYNSLKKNVPMDLSNWLTACNNNLPNIAKGLEFLFWFRFLKVHRPPTNTNDVTHEKPNQKQGNTSASKTSVNANANETLPSANDKPHWPPRMANPAQSKLKNLPGVHWMLSLVSEYSQNLSWDVIYTASSAGYSLSSLQKHTQGYTGPTLLLIQGPNGHLLGSSQSVNWNSSTMYQADSGSFLFTLASKFAIFRHKNLNTTNDIYIFNNTSSRSVLRLGIGLGQIAEGEFRLFIEKDLQSAKVTTACNSYETGPLFNGTGFEVFDVEVWGVGGPKCSQDQQRFKSGASADADKRNRMQAKGQWGEGADHFLMDFAGKTVDANILAGIRKEEESSTDEENRGVIHFPANLRGKNH